VITALHAHLAQCKHCGLFFDPKAGAHKCTATCIQALRAAAHRVFVAHAGENPSAEMIALQKALQAFSV
jgi:hypothetical protein